MDTAQYSLIADANKPARYRDLFVKYWPLALGLLVVAGVAVAVVLNLSGLDEDSSPTAFVFEAALPFAGKRIFNKTDPLSVGIYAVLNLLALPAPGHDPKHPQLSFGECYVALGAFAFAGKAHNQVLLNLLYERYSPVLSDTQSVMPDKFDVDALACSVLPLEAYRHSKDERWLSIGVQRAEHIWKNANESQPSLLTRYWADDMFHLNEPQVQAARVTFDRKFAERAATEMVVLIDSMQKQSGLFNRSSKIPFAWGRANGWAAAAMAELLSVLPKSNANYGRILSAFTHMADTLRTLQTANGTWTQLLDYPGAWEETSCSAMFTFALQMGVKHGWLDSQVYRPIADKAWLGLTGFLTDAGTLLEVCGVTDLGYTVEFFLTRPRINGGLLGQAPLLWTAATMLA